MAQEESSMNFGKSRFRGREGLCVDLFRWGVQFCTLCLKNFAVLWRRKTTSAVLLCIPICMITVLFLSNTHVKNDVIESTLPTAPIADLGLCHAADTSGCIQIVFSPNETTYIDIMENVAELSNLQMGTDIRGFNDTSTVKSFVSNNLGRVQFTVFFENRSLYDWWSWSSSGSHDDIEYVSPLSYVIFYNDSISATDDRSKLYSVDFPLIVLQKYIEHSIVKVDTNSSDMVYDVDYGELWSYITPEAAAASELAAAELAESSLNSSIYANFSDCRMEKKAFSAMAEASPWVFTFGQLIFTIISLQMIFEEKGKKLIFSLRRLGLFDSAYWTSWFVTFQVYLIAGSALAILFCVCVEDICYVLRHIDYNVLFMLLWLTGTAGVANGFFLGAICRSTSMASVLTFGQFIMIIFTLMFNSTPLNSYSLVTVTNEDLETSTTSCLFITSSFNYVYSPSLTGADLVQFMVFFMPWFHTTQALTDIFSIVQYSGESFHYHDMHSVPTGEFGQSSGAVFEGKWVGWSFLMLTSVSLVFIACAWFFGLVIGSDAGEGRDIVSVLFPVQLRRLLFGKQSEFAQGSGDVRGQERDISAREGSIRAYKVSKTYSGKQALTEVSFGMSRGEVFALLGHNGAGKSTLINILTGVCAPTHGKVFLAGLDVDEEMSTIQQMIGVCPQDDLLWDDLTAREHMYMFAAFKGLAYGPQLDAAVEDVLTHVHLLPRADTFARQFSGGMKRRLSVAMSVVGEVEILFLDEPTTGLDPLSRHELWDMINWIKKDKVVVLTTHNMEEADYLGDSIMILHGGRVKAFGNPLFLKDTYGKGYQINIKVDPIHVQQTHQIVLSMLPGSNFIGDDSNTGYVSLTVSKRDVSSMPRFFHWLEKSNSMEAKNVKEWGISNTTLEQVFLILCVQNTEVNYVDKRDTGDMNLCPMCRQRPKQIVVLRNAAGKCLLIPDAICAQCVNNPFYIVGEEHVNLGLATSSSSVDTTNDGEMLMRLLENAQRSATNAYMQLSLNPDIDNLQDQVTSLEVAAMPTAIEITDGGSTMPKAIEITDGGSTMLTEKQVVVDTIPRITTPTPESVPSIITHPVSMSTQATVIPVNDHPIDGVPPPTGRTITKSKKLKSQWPSQVMAVMIKNGTLQKHQRCSNICMGIFIGVMFLLLYVFSVLLVGDNGLESCPGGWVSNVGCGESILSNHIFSSQDFPLPEKDTEVGSWGYYVQNYMVAHDRYHDYEFFAMADYDRFPGLDGVLYDRSRVVWSSLVDTDLRVGGSSYSKANFLFKPVSNATAEYCSSFPADCSAVATDTGNKLMYYNQIQNYNSHKSSDHQECEEYSPYSTVYVNNSAWANPYRWDGKVPTDVFAKYFADVIEECPACSGNSSMDQGADHFFFQGTLWTRSYDEYPYGYASIYYYDDYGNNRDGTISFNCPELTTLLLKPTQDYWSESEYKTAKYMAQVNMLTNNMIRLDSDAPNLIQGGSSPYGSLFFNIAFVSQIVSMVLSIFCCLIMNALFPLTIWRLYYERSDKLTLMMSTVGMRTSSYVFGMYAFDMLTSCLLGILCMCISVGLQWSRFEGAPLGYLICITLLSCHSVNSLAILIVRIAPTKSRLLPLLSAIFSMGLSVTGMMLTILKYPNSGDWPLSLSIIPFFAQARCVYTILVYHETNDEVDISLVLLFVSGCIFLVIALLLEYDVTLDVVALQCRKVLTYFGLYTNSEGEERRELEMVGESSGKAYNQVLSDEEINVKAKTGAANTCVIDADVESEKKIASNYVLERNAEFVVEPGAKAIVVQDLYHQFNTGISFISGADNAFFAVNGVSLALSFGECFGLLGPNGAGKSTTVSILSGILDHTGGKIFFCGEDISISKENIYQYVGVCPQEDIVWADMTVEEHLNFQARQRGILSGNVVSEVQRVAVAIGLDGDAFRSAAMNLSGGMRRRLSIGMSIVGDPAILFLDECTAGLDPENRQHVWRIIQSLKRPDRLILMTSHSMEEAETLCSRIGIMAQGQLQCLGTPVHLKSRYGSGYTVTVNQNPAVTSSTTLLKSDAGGSSMQHLQEKLDAFMTTTVGNGHGTLLSAVNHTRTYKVPLLANQSIAEIFTLMESHKVEFGIREWGVSMATLEEVFMTTVTMNAK